MRKVSRLAATALVNNKTFSTLNNTRVTYDNGLNCLTLSLHGNDVSRWYYSEQTLAISLAGFNTVTTRERVNAVLDLAGSTCRIIQRKGEAVLISTKDPKKKPLTTLGVRKWYSLETLGQIEDSLCI